MIAVLTAGGAQSLAVVFAKDGNARVVIRRQTYEDMWALDTNINL